MGTFCESINSMRNANYNYNYNYQTVTNIPTKTSPPYYRSPQRNKNYEKPTQINTINRYQNTFQNNLTSKINYSKTPMRSFKKSHISTFPINENEKKFSNCAEALGFSDLKETIYLDKNNLNSDLDESSLSKFFQGSKLAQTVFISKNGQPISKEEAKKSIMKSKNPNKSKIISVKPVYSQFKKTLTQNNFHVNSVFANNMKIQRKSILANTHLQNKNLIQSKFPNDNLNINSINFKTKYPNDNMSKRNLMMSKKSVKPLKSTTGVNLNSRQNKIIESKLVTKNFNYSSTPNQQKLNYMVAKNSLMNPGNFRLSYEPLM